MPPRFQELDQQTTPMGELSLRVRTSVSVPDTQVYEVSLNGEFLMSSLVNASERALADLAMQTLGDRPCHVLVGGLGLGYTAAAALAYPNVERVEVVESLEPVIQWHRDQLVPAAAALVDDPRCRLVHGDFFAQVTGPGAEVGPLYDAILLDIDHSPSALLNAAHERFYTGDGLARMRRRLHDDAVFALWSADPPDAAFLDTLRENFPRVESHTVNFYNPLHHHGEENTIVLAFT